MPGADYDSSSKLQVHVVSQSPHTFAYKLWIAPPGATAWDPLDVGNIETPPREYGPFAPETKLAYTVLVAGNPNTDWRTQVLLSQRGELLACSPAPETGFTSTRGAARRDTALVLR